MTLQIAIPSKGRLKEDTLAVFEKAGLSIELPQNTRSYQGSVQGRADIDILFLSASEIARELAKGNLHLGVTGEDLARETIADADAHLEFPVRLGFGHADVVVAVPEAWIDVTSMADLDDVAATYRAATGRRLRISTKYWQLTQNHFRDHGIGLYRIVESLGATEGAPAAGSADVIVDITSTGSTLVANQLKLIENGTILQSQANLVLSKAAPIDAASAKARQEVCDRLAGAVGD